MTGLTGFSESIYAKGHMRKFHRNPSNPSKPVSGASRLVSKPITRAPQDVNRLRSIGQPVKRRPQAFSRNARARYRQHIAPAAAENPSKPVSGASRLDQIYQKGRHRMQMGCVASGNPSARGHLPLCLPKKNGGSFWPPSRSVLCAHGGGGRIFVCLAGKSGPCLHRSQLRDTESARTDDA